MQPSSRDVRVTANGRHTDVTTQTETETETSTTPSSRNDAQGRANENSLTARLRELDRLDAATAVITSLRPDWNDVDVRAVLARTRRPWRNVIASALHCALDPDTRRLGRIETWEPGKPEDRPPSAEDALKLELCPVHEDAGFRAGSCPLCRRAS